MDTCDWPKIWAMETEECCNWEDRKTTM